MHEMSVAVALLDRVLAEAALGGLRTVTQVSVELGALQSIEPDLLQEAFGAAAEGSLAQGARLDIQACEAAARCLACGQGFKPTYQSFVCPGCGKAEVKILRGKELFLLSLSGDSPEPAPAAGAQRPQS